MKKRIVSLILAGALMGAGGMASAARVTGTVESIDGTNYVVKDDKGVEHHIQVDDKTKKKGDVQVGSKVVASVSKDHAKSIKVKE